MSRAAKLDLREFQQELASRLASKTAAQVESSRLGVACAGEHWLVRLADTAEVVAVPPITPVPLTKPWFAGLANLRGNLFSIVDFAMFLGGDRVRDAHRAKDAQSRPDANARLLVLGPRTGELKAGILVERVLGLRNLTEMRPGGTAPAPHAWRGERWTDAVGATWQEIDLATLAQDPAFLAVGL